MTLLDGLPPDLVSIDLQTSAVRLTVDATLYPIEALYGAAYVFIDRCYVLIDHPDAEHFRVTLTHKKPDTVEAASRALVGEFANELLSCAWRQKIAQENRSLIEAVTTQALAGALGPPSIEDLATFDFTEETFEDPLGIAMSWEEKYKKKDKSGPAEPASDAKAASVEAPASADTKRETP